MRKPDLHMGCVDLSQSSQVRLRLLSQLRNDFGNRDRTLNSVLGKTGVRVGFLFHHRHFETCDIRTGLHSREVDAAGNSLPMIVRAIPTDRVFAGRTQFVID